MLDLGLGGGIRIFYCPEPVDMRKSYDGLIGVVETKIKMDPESGYLFVFIGKSRKMIKILQWQGDGFVIWMKRLESGGFHVPDAAFGRIEISERELAVILNGIKVKGYYKRYERKKI
jgi:Transposase and inactivated derivatives